MLQVNQRALGLSGSATMALAARAKSLSDQGLDVISMAVGEPDFSTPEVVREAVRKELAHGRIRYTLAGGTNTLRKALAERGGASRGIQVSPGEVVVTHSCKHALNLALSVLVEPGDKVVMLEPVWASYEAALQWVGAEPRRVRPRADLGPDLDALEHAARGARGVMINSPTNPSGFVFSRAELERVLEIAERNDLWILSDEIYRRLTYAEQPALSPLSLGERARARTVTVDGASKSLAMTGFRIGCAIAPEPIIKAMVNIQSETTGCPNHLSQAGWEAALLAEPPEVTGWVDSFRERRDLVLSRLAKMGLPCNTPGGAFYTFPSVAAYLDERRAAGFCADLLEDQQLVLVPGEVFGVDDRVRISYALGAADLTRAMDRLEAFLSKRA